MSKHTPGPWIGAGPSFGDPLPRYTTEIVTEWEEDDNRVICELPFDHHDDENEANARLIAAAPELLEALKRLMQVGRAYCICYDYSDESEDAWDYAETAIAKAEGEQP